MPLLSGPARVERLPHRLARPVPADKSAGHQPGHQPVNQPGSHARPLAKAVGRPLPRVSANRAGRAHPRAHLAPSTVDKRPAVGGHSDRPARTRWVPLPPGLVVSVLKGRIRPADGVRSVKHRQHVHTASVHTAQHHPPHQVGQPRARQAPLPATAAGMFRPAHNRASHRRAGRPASDHR